MHHIVIQLAIVRKPAEEKGVEVLPGDQQNEEDINRASTGEGGGCTGTEKSDRQKGTRH
jgi:hypothetical protein